MLIEMLVGMSIFLVVMAAIMVAFQGTTRAQQRDEYYAREIQSAQSALARMVHDLRQAISFPTAVQPGVIEFQMQQGGTTYNVEYNCDAPDTLGSPYTRCARTVAVAPAAPPAPGATPGPEDIQHVWNNPLNTSGALSGENYTSFCNTGASGPSGSVFFVENPNTPNPDTSPPACDETYELIVAADPDYVQVRLEVPAGGDQTDSNKLTHMIVLQDGTYLPNIDQGA